MEDEKAVLVRITGRVQGVSFRAWTRDQAQQLGLSGWVRNERDGAVTAMIAGPDSAVATMLERFRRGPALAAVSEVETKETLASDVASGFRILK